MKLVKLSDRIWYYPCESERDRPNLGYIKGDRWSMAVDAGHSAEHTEEFYRALQEEGLPLPSVTVITHWHWDHAFGMHAVNGVCIANEKTNQHLLSFREKIEKNGTADFLNIHETIQREYGDGRPVIITPADIVFRGELLLDAGNCPIRLFQVESSHTDDTTLIQVINERIVFLGDASCGEFPSGVKDPELCRRFADAVLALDVDTCLEGHWTPDTPKGVIDDMLSDVNE